MDTSAALGLASFVILTACMIVSCACAWYTRRQAKAATRRALRGLQRITAESLAEAARAEAANQLRTTRRGADV